MIQNNMFWMTEHAYQTIQVSAANMQGEAIEYDPIALNDHLI